MLKMFLITGAGGFLGTGLRYLSQRFIAHYFTVSFPYGTLIINITGSLLIGIIFALSEKTRILTPDMRMFLAIGLCGGYTTFSSFALDSYGLLKDSQYLYFTTYLFSSVILSILAVIAGIWFIKSL
ncbi:MAG: fluoride efflux transporter CrcB [Bacteroidales bacterium]|nr:fluoride efflux transporter CrcB [Bacteroidales bacterium]